MLTDITTSKYNSDSGEAELFSLCRPGLSYKFYAETFAEYSEVSETIRKFEEAAYSDAVGDVLGHVSNFKNRL